MPTQDRDGVTASESGDRNLSALEVLGAAAAKRRRPPNPAATKARAILELVRRRQIDADQARELIAVPPQTEAMLRAFASQCPGDGRLLLRIVEFRALVLAEFDRLEKSSHS